MKKKIKCKQQQQSQHSKIKKNEKWKSKYNNLKTNYHQTQKNRNNFFLIFFWKIIWIKPSKIWNISQKKLNHLLHERRDWFRAWRQKGASILVILFTTLKKTQQKVEKKCLRTWLFMTSKYQKEYWMNQKCSILEFMQTNSILMTHLLADCWWTFHNSRFFLSEL